MIDLLKEVSPRLDVEAFYLLVFMPTEAVAAHRQTLDELRTELAEAGVTLLVRSMPSVGRGSISRALVAGRVGAAIASLRVRGVTLFHVRSYPAAAATAPIVRLIGGRLIFDPRSPFPEENVTAGRWTSDSRAFRSWKRIERMVLRQAAATVAIAPTHEQSLRQIDPRARTVVIPNNVDVDRFAVDDAARTATRRALGVDDDEVVLCYLGSLNGTWNKPDIYARFLRDLGEWRRAHRLLLIVPRGDHPLVRAAFAAAVLREGTDYLLVHATPDEVPRWLAGADVGLQLFASPDVRVGVKVVEYLAAGLPVVTNRNVLGAAALVEQEGVGIVIDDAGDPLPSQVEDLVVHRDMLRDRCQALARSHYSTDRVADQYGMLYAELLAR